MTALLTEWKKIAREILPAIPGLILVLVVAIVARFLQSLIPGPTLNKAISEILIAVLIGLLVRNIFGLIANTQAGVTFSLHRLLRLGIILLGLRLSLQDVIATGLSSLILIIVCITLALTLAFVAGRLFKIPVRLATLIGVGTAICGNSAIVATAPTIEAKEDEVGFAVATITLFGLIAVIFYPIIGQTLHLTDQVFGLWAGTAVNDTSQVVATAAAYSQSALNIATIVKLTRNTLMAPIMVIIGLIYQRMGEQTKATKLTLGKLVPWFVLGFLAMSLLRTLGVAVGALPQNVDQPGSLIASVSVLKFVDDTSKFLILMALSAIGLGTNVSSLRTIGIKPFVVGLCVATALAITSLSLILFLGLG
jgi:uncharacterized integral membrane protein (TIGR00698 family)